MIGHAATVHRQALLRPGEQRLKPVWLPRHARAYSKVRLTLAGAPPLSDW